MTPWNYDESTGSLKTDSLFWNSREKYPRAMSALMDYMKTQGLDKCPLQTDQCYIHIVDSTYNQKSQAFWVSTSVVETFAKTQALFFFVMAEYKVSYEVSFLFIYKRNEVIKNLENNNISQIKIGASKASRRYMFDILNSPQIPFSFPYKTFNDYQKDLIQCVKSKSNRLEELKKILYSRSLLLDRLRKQLRNNTSQNLFKSSSFPSISIKAENGDNQNTYQILYALSILNAMGIHDKDILSEWIDLEYKMFIMIIQNRYHPYREEDKEILSQIEKYKPIDVTTCDEESGDETELARHHLYKTDSGYKGPYVVYKTLLVDWIECLESEEVFVNRGIIYFGINTMMDIVIPLTYKRSLINLSSNPVIYSELSGDQKEVLKEFDHLRNVMIEWKCEGDRSLDFVYKEKNEKDLSDLPDIEELSEYIPPCIRIPYENHRKIGHIKHDQRQGLPPFLLDIGYSKSTVSNYMINTYERTAGQDKKNWKTQVLTHCSRTRKKDPTESGYIPLGKGCRSLIASQSNRTSHTNEKMGCPFSYMSDTEMNNYLGTYENMSVDDFGSEWKHMAPGQKCVMLLSLKTPRNKICRHMDIRSPQGYFRLLHKIKCNKTPPVKIKRLE